MPEQGLEMEDVAEKQENLQARLERMGKRIMNCLETPSYRMPSLPSPRLFRWLPGVLVVCWSLCGCQALTNPLLDGIPARRVPPEYLGRSRESLKNVPLSALRQPLPNEYLVDSGDILGIYVENVLPKDGPPPVNAPATPDQLPSVGLPILVQLDGTITLPLLQDPIRVRKKTTGEIQKLVAKAYEEKGVLNPKNPAQVTLFRKRTYHVLVVRQDSASNQTNATGGLFGVGSIGQAVGITGRGTGTALDLPAYENDVMNALTRSGGLPGFDAADEVLIERGSYRPDDNTADAANRVQESYRDATLDPSEFGLRVTRIPLRLPEGQKPTFKQEDVILHNGDVVYIASRNTEVFYTGGLLFTGQYQLPRDYDLGVVEAIAVTRGTLVNGGVSSLNNFTGGTGLPGIGTPNPSSVSIVRHLPRGQQLVINVDLNRAMRDPRENVIIQPKDVVILQFTPGEAIAKYFTSVFSYNFFGTIIKQQDLTATSTLTGP